METKRLSRQQQKYYRAVIVPAALSYYEEKPMDMVRDILEAVKYSFTKEFIHELLKMQFNHGRSTNDLVASPQDFLMSIWAHFDKYGRNIPLPPQPEITSGININNEDIYEEAI